MIITFDIETLPTYDKAVIAEFATKIAPPGNIKKQESIDAWMAENRESALADMVAKTSFDGMYGRIACICWAIDYEEPCSTLATDSEEQAIRRFYDAVLNAVLRERNGVTFDGDCQFVGHNIVGFDLPFLKHRSIINSIVPPRQIIKAFDDKWGREVKDTMLMWSSDPHRRGSMDRICRALGIPGKGDFDGSMVAETWPVNPQKVIDYCKDDVERTRQMYRRMTFDFPSNQQDLLAA